MNDTYFTSSLLHVLIYLWSLSADGYAPSSSTTDRACNGQFGEGAIKAEALLLASPLCRNTAPELQHFPLTLFPTAGSFSTTFKAVFPAPCLEAEHQAGLRSHAGAWTPTRPLQECRAWEVPTGCLLLYLAWMARPAHSTVCTASGRVQGNNVLPSQAKHGEVKSCRTAWRRHTHPRQVHLCPALTAQLPTLAPAHTTSLPGMRFCDLGGRKVLEWAVPVQSTALIPLRCGTHGFRNNPVFITLSN